MLFRTPNAERRRRRRTSALPLQEQIDAPILDLPEAETLVQPQRGVEALDVDAERLARGLRFGLELTEERGPDAAVAELGQQGDVDDADLVGPAGDVEPPDGFGVASRRMTSKLASG